MTTAVAPPETPTVTVTSSGRWRGVLGVMDSWSADQRMLVSPQDNQPVRARPLPLPLLVQPELAPGHDGGKLGVGVIDRVWTEQGFVMGEGRFDMDDPAGVELARKVGTGFIRFVSLDVDDATAQQVCLDQDGEATDDCTADSGTGMVYTGWRIMGATLLAHPAFPDAHIALADDTADHQSANSTTGTTFATPQDSDTPIVGYNPEWGCVVPNEDGTAWLPADCATEGAVQANAQGDAPYDPEEVADTTSAPMPEEEVDDEGNGCVAPDPGQDGAWLPVSCDTEGAVPANADGTGPLEEITDAANDAMSITITLAEGDPTHAGVAIKALDTGRILMLQRALDPEDPASGLWEFPGGSIDPGEDPQAAAWREFQEETGTALPDTVTVVNGWRSPNGIYQGFVATVPTEGDITINPDREDREDNPDDPDKLRPEVVAWWDLAAIPDMPALRPEVSDTPWNLLEEAGTEPATPADTAAAQAYAIPMPGADTAATDDPDDPDDPASKDRGNGCVCEQEDGSYAPCDCTLEDAETADADGNPVDEDDRDSLEMAAMPTDCKPCQAIAITASAAPPVITASATGWTPPAEYFTQPPMDGPCPITVDPETGQLSGLLAAWGTCHVGFKDRCVTPPRSATGYSFFHTARITTDRGALDVGIITMDTGHADLDMTASGTVAHYDNTGTQAAVVRVGENEHGIWVAGVTLPFVTQEQRLRLSLASFSGDWRHIRGGAELVAALAVNTPGFPLPGRRTGDNNIEYALVAAGALPPAVPPAATEPAAPATTGAQTALGTDPAEVARIVMAELDKREQRKLQAQRLTDKFTTLKAAEQGKRMGRAAHSITLLSQATRESRIALARSKVGQLVDSMPKNVRALKSDLDLASRPDFANWVEQQGGLPRKIRSVANELKKKGMGESQAIAVAVNVAKKACASGDTNWPGRQSINAKSRAEFCAAVARWEEMKAAARAARG